MGGYVPTRFYWGGVSSTNGDTVLYNVPAGKTAIVTDWWFGPGGTDKNYDNYIYPGNTCLSYNRVPGGEIGAFRTYAGYHYHGFYVVPSGENIIHGSNTATGESYTSVSGLLGQGDISGKTPTRLMNVVSAAGTSQYNFGATGNGWIVKTILLTNYNTGADRPVALRINGIPIAPWHGNYVLLSQEVKQMDGSWFMAPGDTLNFDDWGGFGSIRFTAFGWQL